MCLKHTIFIVENNDFFRKGLAMVINNFEGLEVCGEAVNGAEFLKKITQDCPDLVLMDIKMPVMDGVEATRKAVEIYPNIKIAALTMFGDEEYLQSMIHAGACGFLLKDISKNQLEEAVRQMLSGNNYYSPELLGYFTKKYLEPEKLNDRQPIENTISKRELEILRLVARGHSNAEIAVELHISNRTVEGHKSNLILKTGSKNIIDLLIYAIKNNLVQI